MSLDLARLRATAIEQRDDQSIALLDRLELAEKTAAAGMALHCALISTGGDCADDRVCTADQELIDANAAWRALAGKS